MSVMPGYLFTKIANRMSSETIDISTIYCRHGDGQIAVMFVEAPTNEKTITLRVVKRCVYKYIKFNNVHSFSIS